MKSFGYAALVGSLALAQPALAQAADQAEAPPSVAIAIPEQTDGEQAADALAIAMVTAMIASMFQPEPLTPGAEARLPAAEAVVASLVPQGVYGEMMGQLMDSFLGPIFEMADLEGGMDAGTLAEYTGLAPEATEALSAEQRAELTAIFDPVYETRNKAEFDAIVGGVNAIFATLEPGMRDGLARAYASRFEADELAELQAFFTTPAGAKYARQSLLINTDPQVIAGMMQAVPGMMEQLPAMLEGFENAEAGLPEPRRYDDLTPAEQRRAAQLLGVDQATLRERMAEAELMENAVEEAAADTQANLDAMGEAIEETGSE